MAQISRTNHLLINAIASCMTMEV